MVILAIRLLYANPKFWSVVFFKSSNHLKKIVNLVGPEQALLFKNVRHFVGLPKAHEDHLQSGI